MSRERDRREVNGKLRGVPRGRRIQRKERIRNMEILTRVEEGLGSSIRDAGSTRGAMERRVGVVEGGAQEKGAVSRVPPTSPRLLRCR